MYLLLDDFAQGHKPPPKDFLFNLLNEFSKTQQILENNEYEKIIDNIKVYLKDKENNNKN